MHKCQARLAEEDNLTKSQNGVLSCQQHTTWCAEEAVRVQGPTMGVGGDMGAVGAEHAGQPKVCQLAHKAARILGRNGGALQQHVGALQVAAHRGNCRA